ncbi:MAG: LamB/YcsF family protein [Gemmatimonadaceae bacterium]
MAASVDLNADLGEGFGKSRLAADQALLDLVSSANIACGFHAGDATTMRDTVRAAQERGVSIGAHPSYPDIPGFGRRELNLSPREITFHVTSQLHFLKEVCVEEGARLFYVKPHGAMYNRAATDVGAANAIAKAIHQVDPALTLLGLANSRMRDAAARHDLRFASEAFADRAYLRDGTLVPRSEKGAVLVSVDDAVARALRLVRENTLVADNGDQLNIYAQSLCVHGDNPDAILMLRTLRSRLEAAGITVKPFAA